MGFQDTVVYCYAGNQRFPLMNWITTWAHTMSQNTRAVMNLVRLAAMRDAALDHGKTVHFLCCWRLMCVFIVLVKLR